MSITNRRIPYSSTTLGEVIIGAGEVLVITVLGVTALVGFATGYSSIVAVAETTAEWSDFQQITVILVSLNSLLLGALAGAFLIHREVRA